MKRSNENGKASPFRMVPLDYWENKLRTRTFYFDLFACFLTIHLLRCVFIFNKLHTHAHTDTDKHSFGRRSVHFGKANSNYGLGKLQHINVPIRHKKTFPPLWKQLTCPIHCSTVNRHTEMHTHGKSSLVVHIPAYTSHTNIKKINVLHSASKVYSTFRKYFFFLHSPNIKKSF